MKISKNTLAILKNFSVINPSMVIDETSTLKIITDSTTVVGVYDTEEKFPAFALYNLPEFVNVLSLFDESKMELDFQEKFVMISDGVNSIKYLYTHHDLIKTKPKESSKYKAFQDFHGQFELTKDQLNQVLKAASVMRLTKLQIVCKDNEVNIRVSDKDRSSGNVFNLKTAGTGETKITIDAENIHGQILPGDYTVKIHKDKIIKFENKNMPLFYFVSATATSKDDSAE